MKIFLVGGTGFIGTNFLQLALGDNHFDEIIICVNKRKPSVSSPKIKIHTPCRIDDIKTLKIDKNTDYIIDFAGIIKETRDKKFERVHHEGVKNLLRVAHETGARGFVYISAAGVDGTRDEAYMKTKWLAEEEIRKSGLEYLILRPSIVLGPDGDFTKMLKIMFKLFPFIPVIGEGNYKIQPIFVGDLVEIVRRGILQGIKGTFGACGPDAVTYKEFLKMIKEQLKIKRPLMHIPVRLVSLFAQLGDPLSPVTGDQLKMLLTGSTCKDSKIFTLISYAPKNLEETIRISFLS